MDAWQSSKQATGAPPADGAFFLIIAYAGMGAEIKKFKKRRRIVPILSQKEEKNKQNYHPKVVIALLEFCLHKHNAM